MFLIYLMSILIVIVIADYLWKTKRYSMYSEVGGPPIIPIIGTHYILRFWSTKGIMRLLADLDHKYNGFICAWGVHRKLIMNSRPEDLELILSSTKLIKKSSIYWILRNWLGRGLLLSSGKTSMGVKVNAQTDTDCVYTRNVLEATENVLRRALSPITWNPFLYGLIAPKQKKRYDQAVQQLHEFTNRVIRERRATFEASEIASDDFGAKRKVPLLDILLQSTSNGQPLSDTDIREEVDTFMFGGQHTTASAISFTLYCISRHPDVQQKVFNEIREVMGEDRTKPITYSQLQELKYIELVIKESMRMYVTGPFIGRYFTEETLINGVTVPAGTELLIPMFILMKNPDVFPDPEKFDPERHSVENTTEKSKPYGFLPFSAGPRNCIGQRFAWLEMKSVISKILRYYELLPLGDEPDAVIGIVMKSLNGVNLGLRQRIY